MPILDGRLLLLAEWLVVVVGDVIDPISLCPRPLQQGVKHRPPIGCLSKGDLFPLKHHLVTGVGKNGGGDTGLPTVCMYLYRLCRQVEICKVV